MKPLLHLTYLALLAYSIATADHLPPLGEVVVDYVESIETVTVNGGHEEVYFIDRVNGRLRYIDYCWFMADETPLIDRVGGEWRMFWWDECAGCYRAVYASRWYWKDCKDFQQTPKWGMIVANGGWWKPVGLTQPAGRWW